VVYLGAGPRDTVCNCNVLAAGDVEAKKEQPGREEGQKTYSNSWGKSGWGDTRLDSAGRWIII